MEEYRDRINEYIEWNKRSTKNLESIYVENTRLTLEEVQSYMEKEYIFTAKEAVEAGFIESIGSTTMFTEPEGNAEDEARFDEDEMDEFYSMVAVATYEKESGKKTLPSQKPEEPPADPPTEPTPEDDKKNELNKTEGPESQEPPTPPTAKDEDMPLSKDQAIEVRTTLGLPDDHEVTMEDVAKAFSQEKTDREQDALTTELKEKAEIKTFVETELNVYFNDEIINAADRDRYVKNCINSADPKAQCKVITEGLERIRPTAAAAKPAEPDAAAAATAAATATATAAAAAAAVTTDADPAKAPGAQALDADPQKAATAAEAGKAGEDGFTRNAVGDMEDTVENCTKRWDELIAEDNSDQGWRSAMRIVENEFSRDTITKFQTQGRSKVAVGASGNVVVNQKDLKSTNRWNNKMNKKPIYV